MRTIIISVIFAVLLISCNTKSLMKPDKSDFLTIDDSKIYYEVFGEGEPLILIHAGVTDSRMWDYQIEDLSKNFKVIRFDQRGFGKSDIPKSNFNAVKDIITLMDSCKISKAHIVGICLGALQALDLAIEYPDRVKSLIISGSALPDWPQPKEVMDKHIDFSRYVAEKGPDSAVKKMLTDPFWSYTLPNSRYKEARKLFEQILRENKESFTVNWQLRELPLGLTGKLQSIKCPVLMFRPENEMPSIVPIADTIAKKISKIEIAEIPEVYHLLNMETPEEFNREIIRFVNKNQ